MKIQVLGVGGGLSPQLGNTSMLIWDDDCKSATLLDCGYTVIPRLVEMGTDLRDNLIAKINKVFISHLHADHAGGLGALGDLTFEHVQLAGPDNLEEYLRLARPGSCNFDIVKTPNDWIKLMPTMHVSCMESYAALLFGKVFYSGDTGYSLLNTDMARRAKLVIHECALTDVQEKDAPKGSYVHVGIDTLAKESSPEVRAKTWLCHYSYNNFTEFSQKAAKYGFAGLLKERQVIEV